MSVQTLEQRLVELRDLRRRVDAEVRKVKAAITDQRPAVRPRRSRYEEFECGTDAAYHRHRYRGEPCDDACRIAHAAYERERAASRRAS